jgi:hypothetical protein
MTGVPSDEVAERRARALQYRQAGLTYPAIAKVLGLPSAAAAAMDVQRSLVDLADLREPEQPLSAELERVRLEDLERNVRAIMQNAAGGDPRLANPELVLACTDRLLKIAEQRAALPGGRGESADELRRRRYPKAKAPAS